MAELSYLRTVEQVWDGDKGLSQSFTDNVGDVFRVNREGSTALIFAEVGGVSQEEKDTLPARYGGSVFIYKTKQTWQARLKREQGMNNQL